MPAPQPVSCVQAFLLPSSLSGAVSYSPFSLGWKWTSFSRSGFLPLSLLPASQDSDYLNRCWHEVSYCQCSSSLPWTPPPISVGGGGNMGLCLSWNNDEGVALAICLLPASRVWKKTRGVSGWTLPLHSYLLPGFRGSHQSPGSSLGTSSLTTIF